MNDTATIKPSNKKLARQARLPIAPRGLTRVEAATYVGIGTTKFDEMVAKGRMPKPKRIDGSRRWDRYDLDDAWDNLPESEDVNEWDSEE